ncbi:MAG: hypothetical protein IJX53_01980 [Clostridia bacterium]|nr:hypothetical protein [Clostridia bacterium]
MNRTLRMPAARTAPRRRQPTLGDWLSLLFACLCYFFGLREVQMGLRIFLGGGAFMLMLGFVGGIECGMVALVPGGIACFALVAAAFLLLRGLGDAD